MLIHIEQLLADPSVTDVLMERSVPRGSSAMEMFAECTHSSADTRDAMAIDA